MHGVGIKAMGILMDRIMSNIGPEDQDASDKLRNALSSLKNCCAWTEGEWLLLNGMPWNYLQNTVSHVRLLSNMLIRVYAGVHKS